MLCVDTLQTWMKIEWNPTTMHALYNSQMKPGIWKFRLIGFEYYLLLCIKKSVHVLTHRVLAIEADDNANMYVLMH